MALPRSFRHRSGVDPVSRAMVRIVFLPVFNSGLVNPTVPRGRVYSCSQASRLLEMTNGIGELLGETKPEVKKSSMI